MTHGHPTPPRPAPGATLGAVGASLEMGSLVLGLIALLIGMLMGFQGWLGVDETFFWRSYLVNFGFVLAISLGALFFVIIQHLTRAGWSVVVRRPAEVLAYNLRWLWVLFILPFGWLFFLKGDAGVLWPWANMASFAQAMPAEAALVEKKAAYFTLFGFFHGDFFWLRAILYFVIWGGFASFYMRRSLRLGMSGDVRETLTMQTMSAPAVILFALSTTFAAFDWIMSINPAWFSTMFGVYFFCGCCTCGFAALAVVCTRLRAVGALTGVVTLEHLQDLGKFIWAFGIVFWAYIGFSQYMLIWYANIPEESIWFVPRQLGNWAYLSIALLFGHFVVPFLALISKWPKRTPNALLLGAIWMLAFGWLDLYWMIMPAAPRDLHEYARYSELAQHHANDATRIFHPLNLFLLVGFVGIYASMTLRALRALPLVCAKDPRIAESLRFENM